MKQNIILHADMGPQILDHLRQFGNIPSTGILAGQAVDSAITDLFGDGGGVYNDLDIFRLVPGTPRRKLRDFAVKLAARSTLKVSAPVTSSGYDHMKMVLELVRSYDIKSVSRKEMLNFVNCTKSSLGSSILTTNQVISGFDLNCTRVGIDLHTGKLSWDRSYEEFMKSRQLKIVMMHTPWHTLVRLAKKAEELPNVFVDFEAAAQACVGVAQSKYLSDLKSSANVSMLFGGKLKAQAIAHEKALAPYFSLTSIDLEQQVGGYWKPSDELLSNASTDPANIQDASKITLYALEPKGTLEPTLQAKLDNLQEGVLFYAQSKVDESRRAKSKSAQVKLELIKASLPSPTERPAKFAAQFVECCANIQESAYVQGQALPVIAEKVIAWLTSHGAFASKLLPYTLAEQYKIIQIINEVCREFGRKYYNGDSNFGIGVLESAPLCQANPFENPFDKSGFEAVLQADYDLNAAPFDVVPLPLPKMLPSKFKGFVVKELLTPLALRHEGSLMHHCVGGYSSAIRTKRSRIISIKYNDEKNSKNCSTVELQGTFNFDEPDTQSNRVHLIQNRTLSNQEPNPLVTELGDFLVQYLRIAEVIEDKGFVPLLKDSTKKVEALTFYQENIQLEHAELTARLKALTAEQVTVTKELNYHATNCEVLNQLCTLSNEAASPLEVREMVLMEYNPSTIVSEAVEIPVSISKLQKLWMSLKTSILSRLDQYATPKGQSPEKFPG